MNSIFSDPAWNVSALLAAAFGGFLTVWIGRFFGWLSLQFSKENRESWKLAKAQVEARREKVYEHLVSNPMLIVLNALHIALIFALVISITTFLFAVPGIAEGARYSAEVATTTLCSSDFTLLVAYCDIKPINADSPVSDKNVVRYFWIVAPVLFLHLILFFAWFWSRLFHLFKLCRRTLNGYSIASPWF
jgi:sterol desaturase/sphingolipid hydroxylase (fatty acid hydroxylase superfamily)